MNDLDRKRQLTAARVRRYRARQKELAEHEAYVLEQQVRRSALPAATRGRGVEVGMRDPSRPGACRVGCQDDTGGDHLSSCPPSSISCRSAAPID